MRISRNLAYMYVNSNTCLLSIILTKSYFLYVILTCQLFRRNLFSSSSMPVNLNQYRGAVGVFNSKFFIDKKHWISFTSNPLPFSVNLTIFDYFSIILTSSYTYFVLIFFFLLNVVKYNFKINSPKKFLCNLTCFYIYLFWLVSIFLNRTGDIEKNPSPKTKSCQNFSICHWNLNSISAHNFSKMSLLQAYNGVHKYDIICLSGTYLNFSIPYDDDNVEIPEYNLIRADHPSEDKRGGICIYYKHTLPLKVLDIHILQECINFEVKIENKRCNFIVLYCSPSQS